MACLTPKHYTNQCWGLVHYVISVQNSSEIHETLQWRHYWPNSVSNHQPHHCLLNGLFRSRSKKTSKRRVSGLCAGNSPGTVQMASNAENVSIWWRHHDLVCQYKSWSSNHIVILREARQNFRMLRQLKWMTRTNEISRDLGLRWVSDGYPILMATLVYS